MAVCLTIELKECRRRIACPYRRVLCPPLCAACRTHKNAHMQQKKKKSVVTRQAQAPDRPVPAVRFNLHPTSGTERWPQDLHANDDDLKLGAHISWGFSPPQWRHAIWLATGDGVSGSCIHQRTGYGGHLSSTPTTGMWEGCATAVSLQCHVNISREWHRRLWG